MKQHLKKLTLLLAGIALVAGAYSPAKGYVLPGLHVLDLITQNLKNAKRLLISQTLTLYEENRAGAVEFTESLKYVFPDKFRSDITSDNVQRIHLVSKGMALTVIDGKAVDDSETLYDRYKDIILYNSRASLKDKLSLHGVDVSVTSLGRFQGKPVYVLGAQYPDETVPQIWLHKDTFIPFRWIMGGKSSETRDDALDIRYLDWQQRHNVWYPMRIEFFRNETLIREIKVQKIEAAPAFSNDLFDIEHLKSIYLPAETKRPKQGEQKDINEVQRAIEQFKKLYE